MPFSAASNLNEQSGEATRLTLMDTRDTNLHAETQDNISDTSFSLTDALHRLQHLRNSLAELTGRSSESVAPAHVAIVLSDTTEENNHTAPDMRRLTSTIPSTIMERLEEYEASRYQSTSAGRSFSSGILRTPMSQQSDSPSHPSSFSQSIASTSRPAYRAPPFPDLVLPARRSWLETSLSRHRDTSPDDGLTVLGRRISARTTAGSANDNTIPELEQNVLSRTAEMARDLEAVMNRITSQRAARLEQRANEALPNASSRSSYSSSGGGAQANEGRVSNHMDIPFPPIPTNSRRRWRFGQNAGGTGLQSPAPPELADTTNPDVSTVSTARQRRVIRNGRNIPSSSSAATAADPAGEVDNRSYLIRRRWNADGDELVHNLNLSHWNDDDSMEWFMPPTNFPAHDYPDARNAASRVSQNMSPFSSSSGSGPPGDQVVNAMPESTTSDVPRRPQGWARLNADGNEITTEAEDEMERAHARSRVRALVQIRTSASSATPRRETLIPMTRTSIAHVWDDDEGVTARVRINSPGQTVISPLTANVNAISSESSTTTHLSQQAGSMIVSPCSFDADPLPMPLVDMMSCSPALHRPYPRTVSVHKYASLAGR